MPGDFYVDHTCIDCDTCRWMAPATFAREGRASAVVSQPTQPAERLAALHALISCPTFSIHVRGLETGELAAAAAALPKLVPGTSSVFHCGYHDELSFSAMPYLVLREGGNVMVDVPRFDAGLLARIQALGGVQYMFMTHEDDVAQHDKWAAATGAQRIIHADAQRIVHARHGPDADMERVLCGSGPWALDDGGADVQLLHTPGHTPGSCCLLYTPGAALFSGDHLAYSWQGKLTIFRQHNWHSVDQQLTSVEALVDTPFLHLLPAHGRQFHFAHDVQRTAMLNDLLRKERGTTVIV